MAEEKQATVQGNIDLKTKSDLELVEIYGQQYEELFRIQNNLRTIQQIVVQRKQAKISAKE